MTIEGINTGIKEKGSFVDNVLWVAMGQKAKFRLLQTKKTGSSFWKSRWGSEK